MDLLPIASFKVRDQFFISPVLAEVSDQREFINFELLVFGGMGIVKSPLLERDISTDKVYQPAVLLVTVLNYREQVLYNVHEHWLLSIMDVWSRTLYQKREVNALFICNLL